MLLGILYHKKRSNFKIPIQSITQRWVVDDAKRQLVGGRNNKKSHIKVTCDFDEKVIVDLDENNDPETLKYFEKLAS